MLFDTFLGFLIVLLHLVGESSGRCFGLAENGFDEFLLKLLKFISVCELFCSLLLPHA